MQLASAQARTEHGREKDNATTGSSGFEVLPRAAWKARIRRPISDSFDYQSGNFVARNLLLPAAPVPCNTVDTDGGMFGGPPLYAFAPTPE
jgi:hypothetical protein